MRYRPDPCQIHQRHRARHVLCLETRRLRARALRLWLQSEGVIWLTTDWSFSQNWTGSSKASRTRCTPKLDRIWPVWTLTWPPFPGVCHVASMRLSRFSTLDNEKEG